MVTPAEPFDPPTQAATVEGRTVTYTQDGTEGPALVLVHGLPGSVRDFRWLDAARRQIKPQARTVRIDLPGFGGTDAQLGGDMSVHARAAFLTKVFEVLDLRRILLVGHSMGGPVALAAAAAAPDRVRALGLLASVGRRPHRGYRAMPSPRLVCRIFTTRFGRRFLVGPLRKGFVSAGFPRSTSDEALFLTMEVFGALRFATVRRSLEQLQGSSIPVLAFGADDDPLVERPIVEELSAALGAQLQIFDDGGHNIQKTRAVEIAQALVKLHDALSD